MTEAEELVGVQARHYYFGTEEEAEAYAREVEAFGIRTTFETPTAVLVQPGTGDRLPRRLTDIYSRELGINECGECQGEGSIVIQWGPGYETYYGFEPYERVEPCPRCQGTGRAW